MAIIEGGTDIKVKTSMSIEKCFIRNICDKILIRYRINIIFILALLSVLAFGYFWFEDKKIQNFLNLLLSPCFGAICFCYERMCKIIDSKILGKKYEEKI